MNYARILILLLFIASALGYLTASAIQAVQIKTGKRVTKFPQMLLYISKPLMMPLLLILYLLIAERAHHFIIAALLFGFLGDTLLLKGDKKTFFMAGLVSFLLGHIAYTYGFLSTPAFIDKLSPSLLFFVSPYVITGLLIYRALYPGLGSMKIPTAIYMSAILIMSLSSLLRFLYIKDPRSLLPLIGSILFITSDTALAMDKFRAVRTAKASSGANSHTRLTTILKSIFKDSSYVLAQVLIVSGFTSIS